jgi:hypothetical protein
LVAASITEKSVYEKLRRKERIIKKIEKEPYRFKIRKHTIVADIIMLVDVFRKKVTYIEA